MADPGCLVCVQGSAARSGPCSLFARAAAELQAGEESGRDWAGPLRGDGGREGGDDDGVAQVLVVVSLVAAVAVCETGLSGEEGLLEWALAQDGRD
jgi:hypothetical protein